MDMDAETMNWPLTSLTEKASPLPSSSDRPVTYQPPSALTALFGTIAAMVAALVVSVVFTTILVIILVRPHGSQRVGEDEVLRMLADLADKPGGLILLLGPAQLCLLLAAYFGASRSDQDLGERLGMRRFSNPWVTMLLVLGGTIFVGMISNLIAGQLVGEGGHLEYMLDLMHAGAGMVAVSNVLILGLVPGICEEVLFRGFLQERLLQSWNPLKAITVSTFLFAILHVDPAHAMAVVPLGAWFGFVAWRTGSLWTAIICHTFNNVVTATTVRVYVNEDGTSSLSEQAVMFVLIISFLYFVVGFAFLLWRPIPSRN